MNTINSYEKCCEYILDIPKFAAKNTLEDTHRILDRLYIEGSSKVVHIAGTNGKGSTTSFLASILRTHGYRVGMFTSPHLVSMTERIRIDDNNISEEDFYTCFQDVLEAVSKEGEVNHPSFFEFIFLMAMDYFSKNKVDYILLETGLGGRLDATNCINDKCLSVITKIGLDHMEYLGDTIEKIAYEKAGIVKENVPLVFWDNKDISAEVIKKAAENKNIRCYSMAENNSAITALTKHGIDFCTICEYYKLDGLSLNVSARYQIYNASLAITSAYVLLEKKLNYKAVGKALKDAYWPGRMEEIGTNIFLDGAHNEDGIEALIMAIRTREHYLKESNLVKKKLLFSMVQDKEYRAVIKQLLNSNVFSKIYVSTIDSYRKASLSELKTAFEELNTNGVEIVFNECLNDAYRQAVEELREPDELYIAGSLYLVGEIKKLIS